MSDTGHVAQRAKRRGLAYQSDDLRQQNHRQSDSGHDDAINSTQIRQRGSTRYSIALPGAIPYSKHTNGHASCVVVRAGTSHWPYRHDFADRDVPYLLSTREAYETFLTAAQAKLRRIWNRAHADALYHLFVHAKKASYFSFGSAGAHGYVYAGILHGLASALASSTYAEYEGRLGDADWAYEHIVLRRIKGVVGSSAGAFAAVAVASKASLSDILGLMCGIDVADALEKDISIALDAHTEDADVTQNMRGSQPDKHATQNTGQTPVEETGTYLNTHGIGIIGSLVDVVRGMMRQDGTGLRLPSGLLQGTFLTLISREMLRRWTGNADITFAELKSRTGTTLRIVGSSLDQCTEIKFSADSHGDLPVHIALRISASVPGVFAPVELDSDLLSDGGICNSAAIGHFPFSSTWSFCIAPAASPKRDPGGVMINVAQSSTGFHPWLALQCAKASGGDLPLVVEVSQPDCISSTHYAPSPQDRANAALHGHEQLWHWVDAHLVLAAAIQASACRTKPTH